MDRYEVYTDGASARNGKSDCAGGWGFILLKDGKEIARDSGYEKPSSNQRMELTGAIKACQNLEQLIKDYSGFTEIIVNSDSAYLINCFQKKWYQNWQNNGWLNSAKQPVANKDLWEQLIPFFGMANIKWNKVKGHSGNVWNDEVDKLAVAAKFEGDAAIKM